MRSIAIIGLSVFVRPHISRTRVEISQRSFYTSYPQPWLDFSLTTLRCTFSSLADIMLGSVCGFITQTVIIASEFGCVSKSICIV